MHVLRLNLVLSEAQNCYAKDRFWKSAVREISLAVHANFVFLYLGGITTPINPPLYMQNMPILGIAMYASQENLEK